MCAICQRSNNTENNQVPEESGYGDDDPNPNFVMDSQVLTQILRIPWQNMSNLRGQPVKAAIKGASAPSTAATDAELIRSVPPTIIPTVSQTLPPKWK
ncbi:uncharacterized protein LOC131014809 isoform X2 [Salvia miltiorrhiza]|uniref:uncharacterized protein LOC131014809 isoform X2 n=1 Tax=Salvia miltiorrhiza TaxID=226208 RepID=UPI0025ABD84C|nr:uncharacterized protein LOC131014809 isoform X2 [Salvia miltiorrhiza]